MARHQQQQQQQQPPAQEFEDIPVGYISQPVFLAKDGRRTAIRLFLSKETGKVSVTIGQFVRVGDTTRYAVCKAQEPAKTKISLTEEEWAKIHTYHAQITQKIGRLLAFAKERDFVPPVEVDRPAVAPSRAPEILGEARAAYANAYTIGDFA